MKRAHATAGMLLGAPVPKVAAVDAKPTVGDGDTFQAIARSGRLRAPVKFTVGLDSGRHLSEPIDLEEETK